MQDIIACIDGSSAASAVCDAAVWAHGRLGAPLRMLHVLDKDEFPRVDESGRSDLSGSIGLGSREQLREELVELDRKRSRLALQQGKHLLEAAGQRVQDAGADEVNLTQRHGTLVESLAELEPTTRMVVIGRHGEAHQEVSGAIGSHLENVIRTVKRPVFVALPGFSEPQSYMIAYDGSPTAKKALAAVAKSDLLTGLKAHVVMVGTDNTANRAALDEARHTLSAGGQHIRTAIIGGDVNPALLDYRREHGLDLLVMGAYGHSRIRRFLVGSTTTAMLTASESPLLLLR
ncbi:universal stress protein [Desulfohalovibrio reitneri]|uniref:universal stress protein n=1 Tax=Desulfohalovibrio reitneri TaxID=1307759 RepID=UPI0004A767E9|nr:universal stress protein [Desulfohalovibrio reitneri]